MSQAGRFAAIDIGTNTILLLVAEMDGRGGFKVLEDRVQITRLGQGVDREGLLRKEAQERSLDALRGYARLCRDHGAGEVVAAGTSALRDAKNREEFIGRVNNELGIELRVLSGEEEAFYSFLAVSRGLDVRDRRVLAVDVGGGSTEFIWGRNGAVERWASLQLGSVRLTERFFHSDPVPEDEVRRLAEAIDGELETSFAAKAPASNLRADLLVGIAGTFTTLAAVEKSLERYSHSDVHGSVLSRSEVKRQIELYRQKTIEERKRIAGLEPKRADVILAGSVLVERIMAFFDAGQAVVSDQGIRYGLLYEKLGGGRERVKPADAR
jgi:exopolyphosphatase/guanosine-5'-triphosphate,3'-diphosphate pyrophosphatase